MPFNQPFAGKLEPALPSWARATPADRLAFYREAGRRLVARKRSELSRAIGANGRAMKPRKRPRPDGADGPVLTPHDEASRTSRLMAFKATSGGVTLFWHSGIGKSHSTPWGTILGFHADGKVRGAPARDVRLSTRGTNAVRDEMAEWWRLRMRAETRKANAEEAGRPGRGFLVRAGKAAAAAAWALVDRYSGLGRYTNPKRGGFR